MMGSRASFARLFAIPAVSTIFTLVSLETMPPDSPGPSGDRGATSASAGRLNSQPPSASQMLGVKLFDWNEPKTGGDAMSARTLVVVLLGTLVGGAPVALNAFNADAGEPLGASEELAPLPGPLEPVREEDRSALETLALYQEPARTTLLEVARHPQTLIALERIQEGTRRDFNALIEPLAEEDRKQIWELVRYPALIGDLAVGGEKTRAEVEAIAQRYPEETRAAAVVIATEHRDLLLEIYALESAFQTEFDALVSGLPKAGEAAFRAILERPELLEILTAHMHLSVLLGEAYARDPERLDAALASVANDVATRTASAQEEWIRTLEEDPEARAELEAAAEAYAEEEAIDYEEVTETRYETQVNVVVHPYPYWFGFPTPFFGFHVGFYSYAWYPWYWYPSHHFGFYYGPRHRVAVYGYPSHHFLSWYYGYGSHYDRYPHLSRHFVRHHGTYHRYSHDRVTHHVERWQQTRHPRRERTRYEDTRVARSRGYGRYGRDHRAEVRDVTGSSSGGWRFLSPGGSGASDRIARVVAPTVRDRSHTEGREARASDPPRRFVDVNRSADERSSPSVSARLGKRNTGRALSVENQRADRSRPSAKSDRGHSVSKGRSGADRSRRTTQSNAGRSSRRVKSDSNRSPRKANPRVDRSSRSSAKQSSGTRSRDPRSQSSSSSARTSRATKPRAQSAPHSRSVSRGEAPRAQVARRSDGSHGKRSRRGDGGGRPRDRNH